MKEWHADGSTTYEYPCFDFPTIGDTLTANNLSWKFYEAGPSTDGYNWSSYDAIKHIRDTSQWTQHVVDYTTFASDAASGTGQNKNGHLFSTRKTLEDSFFVLQSYTVFRHFMQGDLTA